jgi:acyl-coenzyme A thioesterase PaaI-like protein
VLRLPPRRRNENDGGTIHGGVITALAETAHGVAVLWQFPPAEHLMVTKSLRISFFAPARGELVTKFRLDSSAAARIRLDLAARGTAEVTLATTVMNGAGKEVAALEATYVLRRRVRPSDASASARDAALPP